MNSTPDQTLGNLVSEHPSWGNVFEAIGLDFCCGGRQTLKDAVRDRGLDVNTVTIMLEAFPQNQSGISEPNPARLETNALIDHIVSVHHQFVRTELPRLRSLAQKVERVHGASHSVAANIFPKLETLSNALFSHLDEEENELFPAFREALQQNRKLVSEEFTDWFHEHEDVGAMIHQLRDITECYQKPAWACQTYSLLMEGLQAFESDLHEHIHLENNVLFPRLGALS
ncbi:MAG: iron-sulfur cluster repair di-iron protein [Spirochaetales bacterium]|nr:iron-sulfur cluster repair di-iron protein [Spirochaetales bacterium]